MAFGMLHKCVVTTNTYINSQLIFSMNPLIQTCIIVTIGQLQEVAPIWYASTSQTQVKVTNETTI
jgi:hypothetical protein